jgi:UDP-N-acetylmuramate dehydrogenase
MTTEIIKNAPLKNYTYFGIGGLAQELIKTDDVSSLSEIWAESQAQKVPTFVFGGGSNLVFSDQGFSGRVFLFTGENITWRGNICIAEAGKKWQPFMEDIAAQGFSDFEKLSGIPGTIGGAVRGNAGAFGSETQDAILSVEYIDEYGNLQMLKKDQCEFAYRESIFKSHPKWVIVRATFEFKQKENSEDILKRVKELFAERYKKYPPGRSGGSFFKNPKPGEIFAGKLLEECGAKGDRIGDAQISSIHANFLLNKGHATQKDILDLAQKWKKNVFEKFGIMLEPEVVLVDEKGEKISL